MHNCLSGPLLSNRTVIIVTHHVDLVADLAAWVVQLEDGIISAQGTPEDLRKQGLLSETREKSKEEQGQGSTTVSDSTVSNEPETRRATSEDTVPKKLVEKEEKAEYVTAITMSISFNFASGDGLNSESIIRI